LFTAVPSFCGEKNLLAVTSRYQAFTSRYREFLIFDWPASDTEAKKSR
jgi:hypothetical protein